MTRRRKAASARPSSLRAVRSSMLAVYRSRDRYATITYVKAMAAQVVCRSVAVNDVREEYGSCNAPAFLLLRT